MVSDSIGLASFAESFRPLAPSSRPIARSFSRLPASSSAAPTLY